MRLPLDRDRLLGGQPWRTRAQRMIRVGYAQPDDQVRLPEPGEDLLAQALTDGGDLDDRAEGQDGQARPGGGEPAGAERFTGPQPVGGLVARTEQHQISSRPLPPRSAGNPRSAGSFGSGERSGP